MPGRHSAPHVVHLGIPRRTWSRTAHDWADHDRAGSLDRAVYGTLHGKISEQIRSKNGLHHVFSGDAICVPSVHPSKRLGSEGWRARRRVRVDRVGVPAYLR